MRPSGHTFAMVPKPKLPRSSFQRTHRYLTTFNSGYLVPAYVDEVLPGDTYNVSANFFARLATPLTPFMDNLYFDTFWFFVPNRLVWEHWEQFCGQQDPNPGSSTDYLVPQVQAPAMGGVAVGDMADYLGIPTGIDSIYFNSLVPRALLLTFDFWFRDQDLQDELFPTVGTGDGPDTYADFPMLQRCKVHDYFTSSRPWPQKGPSVQLPLGTVAPVGNLGTHGGTINAYSFADFVSQGVTPLYNATAPVAMPSAPGGGGPPNTGWFSNLFSTGIEELTAGDLYTDVDGILKGAANNDAILLGIPFGGLTADISQATAATINAIRLAVTVQQMYERDARGGTRYPEVVQAHFGVLNPDARVQWPEFLSGSSTAIKINPVVQTSGTGATGETTPQGNLAAYGVMGGNTQGFSKYFTEHGHIFCLVNVRADITYQQGMNKMWSRQTRFDFYWPDFANIGEQAVLNKEIYCQGNSQDLEVWGYQEPWAEYRYYPSLVTGEYRSTYAQSLDIWHLALHFTSLPTLGSTFIPDAPPLARVEAVTDAPQLLLDSQFDVNVARVMPLFGVPGLKRF